ncbi:TPM domain-containing protein [Cytophagaceae bacterium YF14B1]|uniref:TPM domain-containing protein n=1 Tax=Xanthocytophaga flava TaxID=3048013 RepID=A0AAE3QQT5_9BACT|nr:TPM domain-containing protein [Xanthocytophaga flavus]MDJ1481436.1 TPM domain-containing protein [Xanthocytophaga flavus]
MKHYIYLFLFFLSFVVAHAQEGIPDAPNPPRLVNDFAGVLSAGDKESLEQKLRTYNDSTSTQFAIVIIRSYGNYDAGDYTFQLANKWAVGQKGKNNGLLITVAIEDRKYFIATGYGLEGSIPDVIAKRVAEQYLKPNFRNQDYYKGLDEATSYLSKLPAGEFKGEPKSKSSRGGSGIGIIVFLFILFFVIIPIIRQMGGGGGRGRGGRGGGFGSTVPPFIIFGSGGSSSSWGGGGGSSGGGFGGFGGGSFGGGGAGGDW